MAKETFGFTIERDPFNFDHEYGKSWLVHLPHQCDEWAIVEESWPEPTTRTDAIAELERFVAEATWALETLKSLSDDWKGAVSFPVNAETPT